MTQEGLNKILKQHKLWLDTDGEEGKKVDLSYVDLRGADLRDADLRGADLKCADLRYAYLKGVDLRDANLTCANLEDANLIGADLKGANLKYANLTNVNLTGSNLNGTGGYFSKGPRHDAIYNSKDDKLYIGCQVHNLDYWLQNYVNIGKKHEYTDEEIEKYGNWIKSLKEIK